MALAMRQNAAKAAALRPTFGPLTASGVKNKGASTKPFLTHWRGRARRTRAGIFGFTARTYTGPSGAEQAPARGWRGITRRRRASFPRPSNWRKRPDLAFVAPSRRMTAIAVPRRAAAGWIRTAALALALVLFALV